MNTRTIYFIPLVSVFQIPVFLANHKIDVIAISDNDIEKWLITESCEIDAEIPEMKAKGVTFDVLVLDHRQG